MRHLFETLWILRGCFLFLLPSYIAHLEQLVLERFLSINIEQVRIGRLVLIVALLAHLASCGWAGIGWRGLEREDEQSWVRFDRVLEEGAQRGKPLAPLAWLRGAYYAASTYMVIVIGDITPYTMDETFFTFFLVLVGAARLEQVQRTAFRDATGLTVCPFPRGSSARRSIHPSSASSSQSWRM